MFFEVLAGLRVMWFWVFSLKQESTLLEEQNTDFEVIIEKNNVKSILTCILNLCRQSLFQCVVYFFV